MENSSQPGTASRNKLPARKTARRWCSQVLAALVLSLPASAIQAEIVRLGSNAWTHGAESVAVTGEALIHTAQFLAVDSSGKLVGGGDVTAQINQVLDNVQTALIAAGSRLDDTVKLNLYVREVAIAEPVLRAVKQRFPEQARPAISLVVTPLRSTEAMFACDVVAVRSAEASSERAVKYRNAALNDDERTSHAAMLPLGPQAYISGQAARGDDLREATGFTLNRLRQNLEFLGLGLTDVVQVKVFFRPASATDAVEEYIHEFFGGQTPPLVFVEWKNQEPIEIELIAAGRPRADRASGAPLEFLTPPGETASPVFSRIAWLDHATTVYLSSLYSDEAGNDPDQILDVFGQLGQAAERARSDFHHLVKATYYVTTDAVGNRLTEIRKGLYDPKRPPAASKATVAGTGVKGRVFTMDMVAALSAENGNSR